MLSFSSKKCGLNENLPKAAFCIKCCFVRVILCLNYYFITIFSNIKITLKSFIMQMCTYYWYLHSQSLLWQNQSKVKSVQTPLTRRSSFLFTPQHFHSERTIQGLTCLGLLTIYFRGLWVRGRTLSKKYYVHTHIFTLDF